MKRLLPALFATLLLSACSGTGPFSANSLKPIDQKPKDREIVGFWKTDDLSKSDVKDTFNVEALDTRIWFHNDGTFEGMDFPDLGSLTDNHQSGTVTGKWEIAAKNQQWELFMHFDKGEVMSEELSTYFVMSQKKKDLVLWEQLGDPATGKRMLFEKVRIGN